MRNIFRIMLGQRSSYANACFEGNFVGTDYGMHQDFSEELNDTWQPFNAKFVPVYLDLHPGKSRVAAGLACGAIWTVSKGMQAGDLIISPDGSGRYRVGEPEGEYWYAEVQILPHRRTVRWHDTYIDRISMSDALRRATGSIGAVANLTHHSEEIENLVAGGSTATSRSFQHQRRNGRRYSGIRLGKTSRGVPGRKLATDSIGA